MLEIYIGEFARINFFQIKFLVFVLKMFREAQFFYFYFFYLNIDDLIEIFLTTGVIATDTATLVVQMDWVVNVSTTLAHQQHANGTVKTTR